MYGRMNLHSDKWFRDADYAVLYKDTGLGRPCVPPSLLVKSLILQNYANLSDRDLVDAIRYDIRYKYALNLPLDHEGFDPSLLSVFRARLLVKDKERAAFERSLEMARESGVLTDKEEQAIDSSPIIGGAALQDTFTLLRTGIVKVLRAIDWQRKKWKGSRGFQYPYRKEKYLANPGKPDIEWDDDKGKRLYLQELVGDARLLLAAIQESGMRDSERVQEASEVLRQIIEQDIEETPPPSTGSSEPQPQKSPENQEAQAGPTQEPEPKTDATSAPNQTNRADPEMAGLPSIKKQTKNRILSTNDTEMRFGHKSKNKIVKGYKSHITTTVGTEIVTTVQVTPANVADQVPVMAAVGQLESAGIKPKELFGDGAYGSADLREAAEQKGIEIVSKLPSHAGGAFTGKRFFELDVVNNRVTCPEGETTTDFRMVRDEQKREVKRFRFDDGACQGCAQREACIGTTAKRREITFHFNEAQLQKAKAQNEAPEFKEEYKKRLTVERVQARLHSYGLKVARYFGERKVLLQATFTAAANNFWRTTKILDDRIALEAPA
jgi:transposase/IS5 family transposase